LIYALKKYILLIDMVKNVISKQLIKELKDLSAGQSFIDFQKKIIKTNKEIIGVRTPVLRKYKKSIIKNNICVHFDDKTDKYFECVLLEGLLIAEEKDISKLKEKLNSFYKKIDNWAIVDMVAGDLKVFKKSKDREEDFSYFKSLLKSQNEFNIRFGIVSLLKWFIDEVFIERTIKALNELDCNFYYVDMAIAWLISEVLIKNPQNAITNMQKIIKNNHFNKFIINKSIQKACDSFRIDIKIKEKLKELRIK